MFLLVAEHLGLYKLPIMPALHGNSRVVERIGLPFTYLTFVVFVFGRLWRINLS